MCKEVNFRQYIDKVKCDWYNVMIGLGVTSTKRELADKAVNWGRITYSWGCLYITPPLFSFSFPNPILGSVLISRTSSSCDHLGSSFNLYVDPPDFTCLGPLLPIPSRPLPLLAHTVVANSYLRVRPATDSFSLKPERFPGFITHLI